MNAIPACGKEPEDMVVLYSYLSVDLNVDGERLLDLQSCIDFALNPPKSLDLQCSICNKNEKNSELNKGGKMVYIILGTPMFLSIAFRRKIPVVNSNGSIGEQLISSPIHWLQDISIPNETGDIILYTPYCAAIYNFHNHWYSLVLGTEKEKWYNMDDQLQNSELVESIESIEASTHNPSFVILVRKNLVSQSLIPPSSSSSLGSVITPSPLDPSFDTVLGPIIIGPPAIAPLPSVMLPPLSIRVCTDRLITGVVVDGVDGVDDEGLVQQLVTTNRSLTANNAYGALENRIQDDSVTTGFFIYILYIYIYIYIYIYYIYTIYYI